MDINHVNGTNSTYGSSCGSDVHGQFLEPTPRWNLAIPLWGVWWAVHVYLLGVLFTVVAIVAVIQSILSCIRPKVRARLFYVTMNCLVTLACATKALNLFIDPYNSRCLMPRALSYLLLHLSNPCLTSTFYLLLVMLIKLSKLRNVGNRLFSPVFLVVFVLFNMALGITADMVTGFFTETGLFLVVCFCYFLLIGLIISIAYFVIFCRLYSRTVGNRRDMNAMQADAAAQRVNDGRRPSTAPILSTKMPMAVKIALAAATLYVLISIVNLFYFVTMMMGADVILEHHVEEKKDYFRPWFWLGYQSVMRLSETLLCGLIVFVTGLPLYRRNV